MQNDNNENKKIIEAARDYIRRGLSVVPIPFRTKIPIIKGWQNLKISEAEVPKYFNGKPQNIGVILGEKSDGLVDIDLDSPEAVKLADWFLPKTKAIFGRKGKRASHWLYICEDAEYRKFNNPLMTASADKDERKNACIVEIRTSNNGKGIQTVFPPSVHECGELIEWLENSEPARVSVAELKRSVGKTAAASLLVKFWRLHLRHELAMAVSGALLRHGFTKDEVKHFIKAICSVAKDDEMADRLQAVEDTAKALAKSEKAFGFPKLAELTDEKIVKAICEWLEIECRNSSSNKGFENVQPLNALSAILFDGKLILEIKAEGKKHKVTAKDENEIFGVDIFNLSESTKRAKFVESLKDRFNDDEQTEISRELIQLADKASNLPTPREENGEILRTSFKVLQDGRIVEQIRTGFAVYEPKTDLFSIEASVADSDGTIYQPIDDELLQEDGGIYLADDLEEYGSEPELDAEIERYVLRYIDLKPLQLQLTAKYIRFTYIFDKTFELSYLNPTGDAGSGKSRFGFAVGIASRRGLVAVNVSAASLFRIVDKYQPTIFIDEANFDNKSDDTSAIIQILNTGFQKIAKIPRQIAKGDGNFQTQMFDSFCPKIIGALKQSASHAFNSRCIEIQMEQTTRNDIPLRLSQRLLNDARRIRNKLTLWRLRTYTQDFEAKLDQAEDELRAENLIPRSIQINIPLFALIEDKKLKSDFIELLKGRDEILNEEKQNSFDGEIVQTLHTILFSISEHNEAKWQIEKSSENQICEDLRIEKIVSMMNATRKEKDYLNDRYIGKKISGLGLRSKQILSRKSEYHKKSAILFDSHKLKVLFSNYGLPVPDDFTLDQSDQKAKSSENNNLEWSKEKFSENQNTISSDRINSNSSNNNGQRSDWSKENSELNGKDIYLSSELPPICSNCGLKLEVWNNEFFCSMGCGNSNYSLTFRKKLV